MRLDYSELEELVIEMYEAEEMYQYNQLYCEHENAGDRV